MFLRANHREKDGKRHTYRSLVETVRTADGQRQRTLCHLGELNDSAQARWLTTIDVFNDAGERHLLKPFPSDIAPPPDDGEVEQVLVQRVRLGADAAPGARAAPLCPDRGLRSPRCTAEAQRGADPPLHGATGAAGRRAADGAAHGHAVIGS